MYRYYIQKRIQLNKDVPQFKDIIKRGYFPALTRHGGINMINGMKQSFKPSIS